MKKIFILLSLFYFTSCYMSDTSKFAPKPIESPTPPPILPPSQDVDDSQLLSSRVLYSSTVPLQTSQINVPNFDILTINNNTKKIIFLDQNQKVHLLTYDNGALTHRNINFFLGNAKQVALAYKTDENKVILGILIEQVGIKRFSGFSENSSAEFSIHLTDDAVNPDFQLFFGYHSLFFLWYKSSGGLRYMERANNGTILDSLVYGGISVTRQRKIINRSNNPSILYYINDFGRFTTTKPDTFGQQSVSTYPNANNTGILNLTHDRDALWVTYSAVGTPDLMNIMYIELLESGLMSNEPIIKKTDFNGKKGFITKDTGSSTLYMISYHDGNLQLHKSNNLMEDIQFIGNIFWKNENQLYPRISVLNGRIILTYIDKITRRFKVLEILKD